MQYLFQVITILLLVISLLINRGKTWQALKIAGKRFISILPAFIIMILLTSVVLGFVTPAAIKQVLGAASNRWFATLIASAAGSIAVMPGFIAFPLGGILKSNGILYMVISAFTTSLMLVGIITFPIEKEFLGTKIALIRNILSFIIALIVAFATGLAYGEVLT